MAGGQKHGAPPGETHEAKRQSCAYNRGFLPVACSNQQAPALALLNQAWQCRLYGQQLTDPGSWVPHTDLYVRKAWRNGQTGTRSWCASCSKVAPLLCEQARRGASQRLPCHVHGAIEVGGVLSH